MLLALLAFLGISDADTTCDVACAKAVVESCKNEYNGKDFFYRTSTDAVCIVGTIPPVEEIAGKNFDIKKRHCFFW